MRRSSGMQRTVAGILLVAFSFLCVIVSPLQAAMVGTANILQQQDHEMARQKVVSFIERQDVAQYFSALGVDANEAKARVATMTDEEISMLADKIDQMPAGGDAVGFLLAVAIIVFIVLLITDMLGVTDVFTFIKKR
jgi:hypothetical protein